MERDSAVMRNAERNRGEALSYVSHEQYSFPGYPNYIPDHLDRLVLTARLLKENGFKTIFFNNGLLGNEAWGK